MKVKILQPFYVKSLFIFSLISSTALLDINAQMYISGRHLYSQAGEKVVMRGVNEMFIYAGDKSGYNIYPEIKKSGANVVRITWNTSGSAQDLKNTIYNCVTRGSAIAMVTLNDATCNFSKVQTCVDYWKRSDVKAAMQDFKKWTILNIANEAGDGSVSDQTYKDTYKSAISQLRSAGYTVPIVIDAASCGQDFEIIKRTWSEIFNSDPQKKVMFSVHTYWTTGGNTKINNMANDAQNNNIPFLIGEGPQQVGYDCNTTIDYKYAMQRFQENQIGWIAWSWGAVQNGDCQSGRKYDITTNGTYGNWVSQWSQDVVFYNAYSIKNTSVRPNSILASNPFAREGELEEIPQAQGFKAYPNPANNSLSVSLPDDAENAVRIEITNIAGVTVFQKNLTVQSGIQNVELNIESLSAGNYLLRATRGVKNLTEKITIVK